MSNSEDDNEVISINKKDLKRAIFIAVIEELLTVKPTPENADKYKEALYAEYPDCESMQDHFAAVSEVMGFEDGLDAWEPHKEDTTEEIMAVIDDLQKNILASIESLKNSDLSSDEDQGMAI